MKSLMIFTFLTLWGTASAQSQFEQFLNSVNTASDSSDKAAIIDSFMIHARSAGIPYIEDSTVNFIFRGEADSVKLELYQIGNVDPSFHRLENTNFFFYSQTFELDARLEYTFHVDTLNILDPENPAPVYWLFLFPASEFTMPGYEYPEETIPKPKVVKGTIDTVYVFSTQLDTTFMVQVYLPPGYHDDPSERFPAIYINDGQLVAAPYLGAMPIVLDNLIHQSKIEKLISVFIESHFNTRADIYGGVRSLEYEDFVLNTMVPYIDSAYRTIQSPEARAIGGASFGGLVSTQIPYHHPEIVGKVAAWSPSYWYQDMELFNAIVSQPKRNIKIYLEWGTYEPHIMFYGRAFRDSVIAKGYDVKWNEWHEGHSVASWRAHTDEALEFLFPASVTNVADERKNSAVKTIELYQNYPNPFNPATTIDYYLSQPVAVKLSIYNTAGQLVETLVDERQYAGYHSIRWIADDVSSGLYFFRIDAGNFSAVKKMAFIK